MARRLVHAFRADVAPFMAMDVLSHARRLEAEGRHIIHMEIGEPSLPAPQRAREAAAEALRAGVLGYTQALGLPSLRRRIARHYRDTYRLEVAPERIAVTAGSSSGFVLAFLTLFNPGDRVLITSPGYPPYRTMLLALGLEPVEVATGPETRWALDARAIRSANAERPLAGVLIMSPANPSGTVTTAEALADIAACCRELGLRLISDEIYHGLSYGVAAETALRFSGDAIVVNSFSKFWCMTGWRIGWMVLPEELERPVERLAQSLFISPPTLSQIGAEEALECSEEMAAVRDVYARNRALLLRELPQSGLSDFLPPDGAFYLYANVARFTDDSQAFARALLDEAGVAATPGLDFDRARGSKFVRFSFAGNEAEMAEAAARIRCWLS